MRLFRALVLICQLAVSNSDSGELHLDGLTLS
jgi:hypothetical protein